MVATIVLGIFTGCDYLPAPPPYLPDAPSSSTPAPSPSTTVPSSSTTTTVVPVPAGQRAVTFVRSQIGTPYIYGGRTPGIAFDCSGLTSWAWEQAGTKTPRTSLDQYVATKPITQAELLPGDLVFYASDGVTVSHVAMYVGGDVIIHARRSSITGVTEDRLSTWWTSARVGFGRVAPQIP